MSSSERRRTPQQERSRVTVEAILHAGAQVFREAGFERASTNLIARVAGISVGSLYQYFPDKQAIARALIARVEDEMLARMKDIIATDDGDTRGTIGRLIDVVIAVHEHQPELVRIMLTTPGLIDDGRLPDAVTMVRGLLERHRDDIDLDNLDAAAWVIMQSIDALLCANEVQGRLSRSALRAACLRLACRYLGIEEVEQRSASRRV
jgi:AcrR family transcriptional regulator